MNVMHDVLAQLLSWWRGGEPVGVATVVATSGSAPLPPGATMIVGPGGACFGSVSGGCVEAAVHDVASEVARSGEPALIRYGIADDQGIAVGLTCGGVLDVFVHRITKKTFPELEELVGDIETGRPFVMATVIDHPDPALVGRRRIIRSQEDEEPGSPPLGSRRADQALRSDALGLMAAGHNATLTYRPDGEQRGEGMRVFYWVSAPRPRLIIFGAIDFAAALASIGRHLGYEVTVCDARPVFATEARFPDADEVVVDWPHRYLKRECEAGRLAPTTAIAVLTHDPKFDVPLLAQALRCPDLGYIGAMGSRRTHELREARLKEHGLTATELRRLHSPIGLDLGARTPEETALSIAAEIVAYRWGGTGTSLRSLTTPVHPPLDRRPAHVQAG